MSALQAFYAGAFSAGTGTPTLAQVLATGNIAGTDINMAQNDLVNVASIQNATEPLIITAPEGISLGGAVGTAGQIITSNATAQPTWTTLGGVGTQNQVLTLNSSLAPVWATPTSGSTVVNWIGDIVVTPMPVPPEFGQSGLPIISWTNLATGYYNVSFACSFSNTTGDGEPFSDCRVTVANDPAFTVQYVGQLNKTLIDDYNGAYIVNFVFLNPIVQSIQLFLLGIIKGSSVAGDCAVSVKSLQWNKVAEL